VGAPKADGPQDTVEAHGSKGQTVGAAGDDGVPASSAAVAVGAATLEVVAGDGSPAPVVSPEGDANVTVGATAAGDPTAKTGPAGGASPSTAVLWDTPLGLPGMSDGRKWFARNVYYICCVSSFAND
jgi:hypothetical protein